jgi:BON domain
MRHVALPTTRRSGWRERRSALKRLEPSSGRAAERAARWWKRATETEPVRAARSAVARPPKRRSPDPGGVVRATAVIGAGSAAGAGLMYLFDPTAGRRRRALLRDRLAATGRRGVRRLGKLWRRTGAEVYGLSRRAAHPHLRERPAPSDAALADRVRSIAFRDRDVPDGRINVNVEDGVVVLRGQLDRPEQIREVEAAVRRIEGVHEVESHLHLPQSPAPNKQGALGAR